MNTKTIKPTKAPTAKVATAKVQETVVSPREQAEAAYQAVLDAAQGVIDAAAAYEAALSEVKAADPPHPPAGKDAGYVPPSTDLQFKLKDVRSLANATRSALELV